MTIESVLKDSGLVMVETSAQRLASAPAEVEAPAGPGCAASAGRAPRISTSR